MSSGKTQRKNPRLSLDDLVSFTTFTGATALGQCKDVSLSGIRIIAAGCTLILDELLRVSFNVHGQTVEAVGRVVRSTKLDDVTTEIALEFVRVDPWATRLLEDVQDEEGVQDD
jgi:hypothetical protein